MKEKTTSRALAEGEARGWRASIMTVVQAKLGAVPDWLPARLEAVTELTRLEELLRGVTREVYPIQLRDRLPSVALPLRGRETVGVDLQAILDTLYDRAGYDAYVDHERAPVPPLEPEDLTWARGVVGLPPPAH